MKERELLWQTGRQDTNFKSGGRFAAATVMTTTFIPTRSGDGAFVLEFGLIQYTLVAALFSARSATISEAKISRRPHGLTPPSICKGKRSL
jgi:hypothetical protein